MKKIGELHAYVGAMGIGKSSILCDRFKKDVEDGLSVLAIKPNIDDRGGNIGAITSRNGKAVPCISVDSLEDILDSSLMGIDKIYIDEVQFFDDVLEVECMFDINMMGIDIEVYGLDLNAFSESFGVMGMLLARADVVYKVSGKCSVCKERPARFTASMHEMEDEISVGDLGDYEPMCKVCYKEHMVDSFENTIIDAMSLNGERRPHPTLENVTLIGDNHVVIDIGGDEWGFNQRLVADIDVIESIGWTVEELADVIDEATVMRFIEEMEEYMNE